MYVTKIVNPRETVGSWSLTDLKIEPKPYPRLNAKVVEGKTTYLLSVSQNNNYKSSAMWYANIILNNVQIIKIPEQKLAFIKVHLDHKVINDPTYTS